MASRHIRRSVQPVFEADDGEEAEVEADAAPVNAFAGLLEDTEDEEEAESVEESVQPPEEEGEGEGEGAPTLGGDPLPESGALRKRKGKQRRKKAPAADSVATGGGADDDDELLNEALLLSRQVGSSQPDPESSETVGPEEEGRDVWRLDAANLDVGVELARKFGKSTMRRLAHAERAEVGHAILVPASAEPHVRVAVGLPWGRLTTSAETLGEAAVRGTRVRGAATRTQRRV